MLVNQKQLAGEAVGWMVIRAAVPPDHHHRQDKQRAESASEVTTHFRHARPRSLPPKVLATILCCAKHTYFPIALAYAVNAPPPAWNRCLFTNLVTPSKQMGPDDWGAITDWRLCKARVRFRASLLDSFAVHVTCTR
jgi:hypothetical protein